MYGQADIKFAHGEQVKTVADTIYLGVQTNKNMNLAKEISDI